MAWCGVVGARELRGTDWGGGCFGAAKEGAVGLSGGGGTINRRGWQPCMPAHVFKVDALRRLHTSAFCAAESGFVHLLCVYCDPESSGGYDDTMSLSFKLPVREE